MDLTSFLIGRITGSGGGVTVEPLSVTANGEYTAPSGKAYSPVSVSVPNTYTESDEGKVVDNGALVSQTSATYDTNDTYDTTKISSVTVNVPQGGGEAPENDVEFIDYDGRIVYSYNAQDFLALSAMPENPTHDGLVAQGWNWSLADAKEYVTNNGGLIIGQMYITDDGKTRIYITIDGHRSPYLHFACDGDAVIDWGDGNIETAASTGSAFVSAAIQHTYSNDGDYIITIIPAENGIIGFSTFNMGGVGSGIMCNNSSITANNIPYYQTVNKIELGKNVSISTSAFCYLFNCRSITFPKGTMFASANQSETSYIFQSTTSLRGCVFPTEINTSAAIGFRSFEYSSVTRVSFPSDFPTYAVRYFFSSARNIKKVYLPPMPPRGTYNPMDYVFDTKDYFYNILKKVVIPEGYTILGTNFAYCQSGLTQIVIPSTILSIGSSALGKCLSLSKITFKSATPPTVSASSAFTNLPADCIIYVPAGSLSAYTTATNYPNPSTYTYVEY